MFAKRGVGLVAPPPVLTTARRLCTRSRQIPRLRQSALDKLAAISSPVLTIDCLFMRAFYERGYSDATWYARYSEYLQAHGKHIAELSPAPFVKKEFDAEPASHVLLGDLTWNSFDTILITEHANGAEAARVVRQVDKYVGMRLVGEGSLTLYGERSAAFAGLPTFDGTAAGDASLSQPTARRSTDCPFIYEKMDSSGWTPARTPAHIHGLVTRAPRSARISRHARLQPDPDARSWRIRKVLVALWTADRAVRHALRRGGGAPGPRRGAGVRRGRDRRPARAAQLVRKCRPRLTTTPHLSACTKGPECSYAPQNAA